MPVNELEHPHSVADGVTSDIAAEGHDLSRDLVTEHDRKRVRERFQMSGRERDIAMAQARSLDLYEHFTVAGRRNWEVDQFERLSVANHLPCSQRLILFVDGEFNCH
jgi:hypothetical protein